MMKASVSEGEAIEPVAESGVGGTDGIAAEVGVGRDGSLVGNAMGNVIDSRLAWREAGDVGFEDRIGEVSRRGSGGGAMASLALSFDTSGGVICAVDGRE